jgi:hypothetical protein
MSDLGQEPDGLFDKTGMLKKATRSIPKIWNLLQQPRTGNGQLGACACVLSMLPLKELSKVPGEEAILFLRELLFH